MNVSSQPVVFPTKNYSSMVFNASPIAVSNKIRAIQARKTRLTPLPNDHDYTDIRRLNFGYNGGVTNSRTDISVLTPERLVDRSKDLRLDRIPKRLPPRSSVLSTNINQPSLLWPGYQASNESNKQHQIPSNPPTITSPTAVRSCKNKSLPCGKIPDINRRQNRQLYNDRQSSLTLNEQQKKTILRKKPSQIQIHNNTIEKINNNNDLQTYETEEDEENIPIDEEFERYLETAVVKCADWLIKYVFNQTIDKQND